MIAGSLTPFANLVKQCPGLLTVATPGSLLINKPPRELPAQVLLGMEVHDPPLEDLKLLLDRSRHRARGHDLGNSILTRGILSPLACGAFYNLRRERMRASRAGRSSAAAWGR